MPAIPLRRRDTAERQRVARTSQGISAALRSRGVKLVPGLVSRILRHKPLTATQSYHINLGMGKLALRKFRKEIGA